MKAIEVSFSLVKDRAEFVLTVVVFGISGLTSGIPGLMFSVLCSASIFTAKRQINSLA